MLVNNMTQRRLDWAVQISAIRSWENKKYEYQWAKKSKTEFLISFNQYKTTIKGYSQIMCIITKTCQSTSIKKNVYMNNVYDQTTEVIKPICFQLWQCEFIGNSIILWSWINGMAPDCFSTSAFLIDGQKVLWTSNVTN